MMTIQEFNELLPNIEDAIKQLKTTPPTRASLELVYNNHLYRLKQECILNEFYEGAGEIKKLEDKYDYKLELLG